MTSVTVCIPSIPGREAMLERALASVQRQRRPGAVRVLVDQFRLGAAATRNRLLQEVDTEWVAWLDDDDELLPNHLEVLMREAAYGEADLIYPTPRMVGGKDPTAVGVNGRWRLPWGVPFGPEQELHLRNYGSFIPITHLVRADLARRAGGFPDGCYLLNGRYRGEDEAYLIALLDAGARFVHVNEVTWRWHVHDAHTAGRGRR